MPNAFTPADSGINVDHVAHFVHDIGAAAAELTRCGFTLTPFSAQSHRPDAGGPLLPAGTANRCVMLRQGYIEFLTPTHDTPNAQQLRAAMARNAGVHLIAFGTDDPQQDYLRLAREGFTPLPPMSLQREAQTAAGAATARFTVVRVPPLSMAEGRIQYCQHHTPEVVWQPRWLDHANHAVALAGVLVCAADPSATAQRYARFTGLPVRQSENSHNSARDVWRLDTARGHVWIVGGLTLRDAWGAVAPTLPWIAGYVIDSDDMSVTKRHVTGRDIGERLCVNLPPTLGGLMIFQKEGSTPWA